MGNLETELISETEKELGAQIPEQLVSLSGSIFYEFKELPQKDTGSGATLSKEVTAYALLLERKTLSNLITQNYIASSSEWQDIAVEIKNFEGLSIAEKPKRLEAGSALNLKLAGAAKAVAKIDNATVSSALTGISRENLSEAMKQFGGVESIRATIRPMWKKSFPGNPAKIYIDTE